MWLDWGGSGYGKGWEDDFSMEIISEVMSAVRAQNRPECENWGGERYGLSGDALGLYGCEFTLAGKDYEVTR